MSIKLLRDHLEHLLITDFHILKPENRPIWQIQRRRSNAICSTREWAHKSRKNSFVISTLSSSSLLIGQLFHHFYLFTEIIHHESFRQTFFFQFQIALDIPLHWELRCRLVEHSERTERKLRSCFTFYSRRETYPCGSRILDREPITKLFNFKI